MGGLSWLFVAPRCQGSATSFVSQSSLLFSSLGLRCCALQEASVSRYLSKRNYSPFKRVWIWFFTKAYYRVLCLIIICWGVIVHLVMQAKFIFSITWLVFLNWLWCQKEYFPFLFLLFSSNINIIKSSRKSIPFPETNKNQLRSILREVFRGGGQEKPSESWMPLPLSVLPA